MIEKTENQEISNSETEIKTVPAAEVEYLEKYLKICERFIGRSINLLIATKELKILNTQYRKLVKKTILRQEVMGSTLWEPDDDYGWVSSRNCY